MSNPDFLLLSQRKELFSNIQQAQMEPSEFEWKYIQENGQGNKATLVHKQSKYYFEIEINEYSRGIFCTFSPGAEFLKDGPMGGDWDQISGLHFDWLNYLKREISTPDVWAMLERGNGITDAVDLISDSDVFTSEELKRLGQGISEIKQFLIDTNELNSQHLKFIGTRLDHLEKVSPTLNKKDWLLLAIGTLTSIIITVCLTPENSRELFRIASSVFSWIQHDYLTLPNF